MLAITHELKLVLRQLITAPGHALLVVFTLTIGIGATTAMFSVVYGVLLRPPPFPDPDRLVLIESVKDFPSGLRYTNFGAPEYEDWAAHGRAFGSLALESGGTFGLKTDRGLVPVDYMHVSDGFFETLDLPVALGRPLANDRDAVVVISDRLWRQQFGSATNTLGRQIVLSGRAYTVVGVARPEFRYRSDRYDAWVPLAYQRAVDTSRGLQNRNGGGHTVIARLKSGVTLEEARADAARVFAMLEPQWSEYRQGSRPQVIQLTTFVATTTDGSTTGLRRSVRPVLWALFAAVGVVLLLACANVTNLMLARQAARVREAAVRLALGAGRGRIVAQALIESALLAAIAGAAGALVAVGCIRLLQRLRPEQLPRLDEIVVDRPVLLFAIAASILTATIAGALPAGLAARTDVAGGLLWAARAHAGSRARRLRTLLVISELAASVVLLVSALLVGRSLVEVLRIDIGVDTSQVISAQFDVSLGRMLPQERWTELANTIVERTAALPGIRAVGLGSGLPPGSLYMRQNFAMPDPVSGAPIQHLVSFVPATPGYFEALGIALVRGRLFTESDGRDGAAAVIITDDLARRFFGSADPIGQTLPLGAFGNSGAPVPVVGVVKNVKYTGLQAPVEGVVYRPFAQAPWRMMFLVARTTGDPRALGGDIGRLIRDVDPDINVLNIRTLDDAVMSAVAQPRFRATLFTATAMLALLLAVVGLYGVVSYSIAQRTAEIGVRMALGATSRSVLGMVVREAMTLIVAGMTLGIAGAYAAAQTLRAFLHGVTPGDPMSFASAVLLLGIVGLAAAYVPARKATRVDPVVALREN